MSAQTDMLSSVAPLARCPHCLSSRLQPKVSLTMPKSKVGHMPLHCSRAAHRSIDATMPLYCKQRSQLPQISCTASSCHLRCLAIKRLAMSVGQWCLMRCLQPALTDPTALARRTPRLAQGHMNVLTGRNSLPVQAPWQLEAMSMVRLHVLQAGT